jgi:hypothetical protein
MTPVLAVVRGRPTDDELVALLASLASLGSDDLAAADDGAPHHTESGWADRSAALAGRPHPGPSAWRRVLA